MSGVCECGRGRLLGTFQDRDSQYLMLTETGSGDVSSRLCRAGLGLFLAQPANNGWDSPAHVGTTTVRVEVFVDDPDAFVQRALAAGADGSLDAVRDHEAPWGKHRQSGFYDPFGHLWLVGDKSPLRRPPTHP